MCFRDPSKIKVALLKGAHLGGGCLVFYLPLVEEDSVWLSRRRSSPGCGVHSSARFGIIVTEALRTTWLGPRQRGKKKRGTPGRRRRYAAATLPQTQPTDQPTGKSPPDEVRYRAYPSGARPQDGALAKCAGQCPRIGRPTLPRCSAG
jgi:hypothetical protein